MENAQNLIPEQTHSPKALSTPKKLHKNSTLKTDIQPQQQQDQKQSIDSKKKMNMSDNNFNIKSQRDSKNQMIQQHNNDENIDVPSDANSPEANIIPQRFNKQKNQQNIPVLEKEDQHRLQQIYDSQESIHTAQEASEIQFQDQIQPSQEPDFNFLNQQYNDTFLGNDKKNTINNNKLKQQLYQSDQSNQNFQNLLESDQSQLSLNNQNMFKKSQNDPNNTQGKINSFSEEDEDYDNDSYINNIKNKNMHTNTISPKNNSKKTKKKSKNQKPPIYQSNLKEANTSDYDQPVYQSIQGVNLAHQNQALRNINNSGSPDFNFNYRKRTDSNSVRKSQKKVNKSIDKKLKVNNDKKMKNIEKIYLTGGNTNQVMESSRNGKKNQKYSDFEGLSYLDESDYI